MRHKLLLATLLAVCSLATATPILQSKSLYCYASDDLTALQQLADAKTSEARQQATQAALAQGTCTVAQEARPIAQIETKRTAKGNNYACFVMVVNADLRICSVASAIKPSAN